MLFNLDILKVKKDRRYLKIIAEIIYGTFILAGYAYLSYLLISSYSKNLISKIALNYGFSEEDLKLYGLDKYIFTEEFLKELSNNKGKSDAKIKEFFENIIYYIGPIQCAIKTRDAIFQINELFEKLSKKKDEEWIKFKVEKI